jgi:hypothetical protein
MLEDLFSTFAEWSEIKILLSLFVSVLHSATHCLRVSTLCLSSKACFFCLSSAIFVQMITYIQGMRTAPTSLALCISSECNDYQQYHSSLSTEEEKGPGEYRQALLYFLCPALDAMAPG